MSFVSRQPSTRVGHSIDSTCTWKLVVVFGFTFFSLSTPAWSGGPTSGAACTTVADNSSRAIIDLQAAIDSITAGELLDHVQVLASEAFEGRKPGTPGGNKASDYIAEQLKSLQLQPCGDNGTYFQSFRKGYRNVLALLPAANTDPLSEVVVVGAHYDHLGIRRPKDAPAKVFNGADDNASGVAAVLELAEAVTKSATRPRRSILFAFWDAEELGLLGSKHWVRNPTIALERVGFAINLDMLGRLRNNHLIIWGTDSATGLRGLVANHNRTAELDLDFRTKLITQSDHYSFFQKGIPILFPWTGMHPQLHRPTDDVERINEQGMERVTRLVQRIVWDLANRDAMPSYREASKGNIQRHPRAPATKLEPKSTDFVSPWGFRCRPRESELDRLIVTTIEENSLAKAANLLPADRIYEVQGQAIHDLRVLPDALVTSEGHCSVLVERNGRFLSFELESATEPAETVKQINLADAGYANAGHIRSTHGRKLRFWNRRRAGLRRNPATRCDGRYRQRMRSIKLTYLYREAVILRSPGSPRDNGKAVVSGAPWVDDLVITQVFCPGGATDSSPAL